jgi:periplasmic divalent cation tolerance protein
MENSDFIVVYCTIGSQEEGAQLAHHLVQDKLAACVNMVPQIRSIYVWQGETCDDGETLLIIKTATALFEPLRQRISELHPYDVPEIIALPIRQGHPPYLEWIAANVTAQ